MAQQVNAPVTMLTTGAQSKGTDGRENRLYVQQNLQEPAAALPHMHTHTGQAFTHVHVLFSHCILSIPLPSNKEVEGEGNLGRKRGLSLLSIYW